MAGERSGKEKFAVAFMIAWIVLWAAGMLIVIYGLATALLARDFPAAGIMTIWLVAAGFGLSMGARKLVQILRHGRAAREGARHHEWKDGTGT